MKVSDLGEFGLIDVLSELVDSDPKYGEAWNNLKIGIGDDAAVWRCRSADQLGTIDALVENVHFRLGLTTWEELGWKSLAVNLSDIAAMGGYPLYALVSLALPPETEVTDIVFFYQGMLALARDYDVAVIGGNISKSPLVMVNIAVIGDSPGSPPPLLTRSAAEPRDRIAVTGYLGAAAAGLEMLENKLQFDVAAMKELQQAFCKPVPRLREGRTLVLAGIVSGMDISDGLISDLGHICRSSGLGARVFADRLPVSPPVAKYFPDTALAKALSGGEDYELLFTAPDEIMKDACDRLENMGCPATIIGEMVTEPENKIFVVGTDGRETEVKKTGWDHFAGENRGI
jgi:thiamine-monophosphate kinase